MQAHLSLKINQKSKNFHFPKSLFYETIIKLNALNISYVFIPASILLLLLSQPFSENLKLLLHSLSLPYPMNLFCIVHGH